MNQILKHSKLQIAKVLEMSVTIVKQSQGDQDLKMSEVDKISKWPKLEINIECFKKSTLYFKP